MREYHNGRITSLSAHEVFVFGSNLAGIHGAGAAKLAHKAFDAEWHVGTGPTGQCYAFPTKSRSINTLPLNTINVHAQRFMRYAAHHPEQRFLLTAVGCGLAGHSPKHIARMFKDAPDNVIFPPEFKEYVDELAQAD